MKPELQDAINNVIESWAWWRVDPVDRCSSVVSDAIADLRDVARSYQEPSKPLRCLRCGTPDAFAVSA